MGIGARFRGWGEELMLYQYQVLTQHIGPRDRGNRDVVQTQRVTPEPPVYLCLLLSISPSFNFYSTTRCKNLHTLQCFCL